MAPVCENECLMPRSSALHASFATPGTLPPVRVAPFLFLMGPVV